MLNLSNFYEYQSYRQVVVNRLQLGPPPQVCINKVAYHLLFYVTPSSRQDLSSPLQPFEISNSVQYICILFERESSPGLQPYLLVPKQPWYRNRLPSISRPPISIALEQTINASLRAALPIIPTQGCGNTLVYSKEISEKMEAPALNGFEQFGGAAILQPTGEGKVNPLEVPTDMGHDIEYGQEQGILVSTGR
jgi:hypothetical protein